MIFIGGLIGFMKAKSKASIIDAWCVEQRQVGPIWLIVITTIDKLEEKWRLNRFKLFEHQNLLVWGDVG